MKAHGTVIWADRIFFEVRGSGARAFLSASARSGISLSRLSCTANGYAGYASGSELPRLQRLAKTVHAEFRLRKRQGPGKILEHCLARSGLLAGAGIFFLMQWYLNGFVWTIDFGEMEPDRQAYFRQALAAQNIWEGCRIEESQLRRAEEAIELEAEDVGWLSLHFTSGCLFVEENERENQQIRQAQLPQALYAKEGGMVLSVELESGFAEVAAGQYIAKGQLLANGQKADRKGQAVVQGASGSIRGQIRKTYTVQQPMQTQEEILTGRAVETETWHVLNHTWEKEPTDPLPATETVTEWFPLHLGRLALPASLCRVTYWETKEETVSYTEETARALAARRCRQAMLEEFPDAKLETENLHFKTTEGVVNCVAEYIFSAEIAQPGPLAPLENTQASS